MLAAPQKRGLCVSAMLFIAGGVVQLSTSLVAPNMDAVYKQMPTYFITVGDIVYNAGQVAGQMFWIYAFCRIFLAFRAEVPFLVAAEIVGWFYLNLGFFDLMDIVVLNPYEHSLPKYAVFLFSTFITLMIFSKWITNRQKQRSNG